MSGNGKAASASARAALRKYAEGKTSYLPAPVRAVFRDLQGTVVDRYRDNRSGTSDGIYTPGWLRRDEETGRFLLPGERQVWDDASPNVPVAVPWPARGDKCADRWGWRAARFQLLAGIDCATDQLVGNGDGRTVRTSDMNCSKLSPSFCSISSIGGPQKNALFSANVIPVMSNPVFT